ncbi:nucleolar MIF4G domain-containing protein 1 homolog [Cimex lectularius]|uniref:MI domain-containing protein n=1 Tax=Cimex lectularius TaxID=79782 RepID=A0A8I6S0G3_CIMLE|nr:nucleolar MIF4G domain-containing protein 1 homolog [Cimex lectularius]
MYSKSMNKSRPTKMKKSKGKEVLSRKERRKQERKAKKQKKTEHFMNRKSRFQKKPVPREREDVEKRKNPDEHPAEVEKEPKRPRKQLTAINKDIEMDRLEKFKLEEEMKKQRRKQLAKANEAEERNIKQLEKQLNLNKRKSKTTPRSFAASGLDYILDVCDSEKIQDAVNAELTLQDGESDFEEDLALITGKGEAKTKSKKIKSTKKHKEAKVDDESDSESSDMESSLGFDEGSDNFDDDEDDDDIDNEFEEDDDENDFDEMDDSTDMIEEGVDKEEENQIDNQDVEENMKKEEIWEDIYGRLRDKKGNIIKDNKPAKYIPPHLREKSNEDGKKKEELVRLKKQLKGLLNRLAENNMHGIANQIDELYMKNSRSDMNGMILNLYLESLVTRVHTPERLVMEHAMLLAILHANVGSEVGAYMLQYLGKQFCEMHKTDHDIENKEIDNLLLLICHMYTFKIFDNVLVYDLLNMMCESFTPKDVDLILVVLRSVGFTLRKDNALALKDFILKVQKLANEAKEMKEDARVKFMLDVLLTIKNNNMAKLPQYDPSHSEHLKKIIKTMVRKGNYITELKITLDDLLKAEERGRWWIVGSAWTGPAPQSEKAKDQKKNIEENSFSQEALELARKQRMNTANRKNIFCILMSAEDYLDAFEKLMRLGLKGQPEQEIIHVLIHCLLQETTYNPYYSYIADQLCMSDRRHKMTLQYSVWDRFKEMKSLAKNQIANFAKFLAHLFLEKSLPLSVLKVLEFTEMDKFCVRLLRQILLTLLLHDDQEAVVETFSRIAKPQKLHMFRESIRLFIHHFLLKNMKNTDSEEESKLKQRISLVDKALSTFSDSSF